MRVLANKANIVTGAGSAIGRATTLTQLIARMGAAVVASRRRNPESDSPVTEIEVCGGVCLAVPGDVRNEAYARELAHEQSMRAHAECNARGA